MSLSPGSSRGTIYSQALTREYSQAPFEEFSWQVHQLCMKIWPSSFNDVHIEYLPGGSSHRVIGLSFYPLSAQTDRDVDRSSKDWLPTGMLEAFNDRTLGLLTESGGQRYVLRISRFPTSSISRGIASVDHVSCHTSIPVPQIVAYDLTPENPIGSPYSLQYRAPGMPLFLVHPTLTYRQQQDLVEEVARVLLDIRDVESPFAGKIDYYYPEEESKGPLTASMHEALHTGIDSDVGDDRKQKVRRQQPRVLHYNPHPVDDRYSGTISTLKDCNAFGIICFHLARIILNTVPRDGTSNYRATYISRLLAAAREMQDLDCFGYESTMKLYHDDFESRNIMVTIDNDEHGTLRISNILDWDDAIFAPPFMSSLPPRWLWSDVECCNIEEPQAYEDPTDPELLLLKDTFDSLVGWMFTMYSYEPQYRLARRLYRFALNGFSYSKDFEDADTLLAEWEELRPKLEEEQKSRSVAGDSSEASEDGASVKSEGQEGAEGGKQDEQEQELGT